MGPVRASGSDRFVCEARVGGLPGGDASSRWLIDTTTDLFPPAMPMIAVTTSMQSGEGRERSAGRTRPSDRPDRSVREHGARQSDGAAARRSPRSIMRRPRKPRMILPPVRRHGCSASRRQEVPQQQDYPSSVHPLQRYAAQRAAPEPDYQEARYADEDQEADPSRYDDALYGRIRSRRRAGAARSGVCERSLWLSSRLSRRSARRAGAEAPWRHRHRGCRPRAGGGGDRRCLCLPHLCRNAAQRW